MVVPCWNHVFSRVQATQVGIVHGGPLLEPRVFTCPGHPGQYVTWLHRVGTTCHDVSKPPRGVSNMVVLSWIHVFSRVLATQGYLTLWS